jgi:hypothetical protein
MSDIRVVFLLLVLAPGVGLAQSSVPEPLLLPPLVSAPPEPEPSLALIPEQSAEARPGVERYSPSAGRVVVEGLGGAAGGVVGTLGGLLIGLSTGVGEDCGDDVCNGRPLGAMGILGFATTAAPSVYVSGRLMGGRGRFIPTVVSGMVAGGLSATAHMGGVDNSPEMTLLLLGFPLIASMVAYEVSAAWASPEPKTLAKSRGSEPLWAPQVTLLPGGGSVGLAGSF